MTTYKDDQGTKYQFSVENDGWATCQIFNSNDELINEMYVPDYVVAALTETLDREVVKHD